MRGASGRHAPKLASTMANDVAPDPGDHSARVRLPYRRIHPAAKASSLLCGAVALWRRYAGCENPGD